MLGLVSGGDGGFEGGPSEDLVPPREGDWLAVALFTLFVMLVLPAALVFHWWDVFDRPPRAGQFARKE